MPEKSHGVSRGFLYLKVVVLLKEQKGD